MMKLTIKNIKQDRIDTHFGSKDELFRYVVSRHPAARSARSLDVAVSAINKEGVYEAAVVPWELVPRRKA